MKYVTTTADCANIAADCLVVGIYSNSELTPSAIAIDKSNAILKQLVKQGDLECNPSQTLMLPAIANSKTPRLLIVGLGHPDELDTDRFLTIVKATASALDKTGSVNVVITLAEARVRGKTFEDLSRMIVEGFSLSDYRFDVLKKNKSRTKQRTLKKVIVPIEKSSLTKSVRQSIREGEAISAGIRLARDLANLPGNICTPSYLANQARKLQRSHSLRVSILNESQMKTLKMGSLLSVSKGSREPAKLIIMKYQGAKKSSAPVVLVGKGLTFDAGGISLKPAGKMDEMKYDMCGGASVFGAVLAATELRLPLNVIGIIPSSENLPDGAANKPGDIVRSMSGRTIEILNTDAEGRLILCDALTYSRRFKPAVVIDIATLTGACVVALGEIASGLFANNDQLAQELIRAGELSHDRAWHLPIWKQYQKQLDSPFADIANIGGRGGGAITAACFLSRFTEGLNWAHLDVAGTAHRSGNHKGATGRPVSLLTEFLIQRAKNAV